MSDVSFSCDNLNFTLVSVGGLPRLFSPLFDSFFFTFSMDVVSDLLEGEHTDEESDSTAELRSELLRGLPRGFRGLDLTEREVQNAGNILNFSKYGISIAQVTQVFTQYQSCCLYVTRMFQIINI